jgi:hypothetical protein
MTRQITHRRFMVSHFLSIRAKAILDRNAWEGRTLKWECFNLLGEFLPSHDQTRPVPTTGLPWNLRLCSRQPPIYTHRGISAHVFSLAGQAAGHNTRRPPPGIPQSRNGSCFGLRIAYAGKSLYRTVTGILIQRGIVKGHLPVKKPCTGLPSITRWNFFSAVWPASS